MFKSSADSSSIYQLKETLPRDFEKVMLREINECSMWFRQNILKEYKMDYTGQI
jgi:hypothetical protein